MLTRCLTASSPLLTALLHFAIVDAIFFLQELNETVGGKLEEFIVAINACYPPEVVEYYRCIQ